MPADAGHRGLCPASRVARSLGTASADQRLAAGFQPGDRLLPPKASRREEDTMDTSTEPPATANRHRSMRFRSAGDWLATAAVTAELAVGGIWDIARLPFVRDLVTHLGYPSYFLVLLGI